MLGPDELLVIAPEGKLEKIPTAVDLLEFVPVMHRIYNVTDGLSSHPFAQALDLETHCTQTIGVVCFYPFTFD